MIDNKNDQQDKKNKVQKKKVKELEKELKRKEKALAEAAAKRLKENRSEKSVTGSQGRDRCGLK